MLAKQKSQDAMFCVKPLAGRSTSERMLAKQKSQDAMFCVKHTRRGRPCPVAGRSLRASCPSLAPCRLRSDILSPLAAKAGSRGTGNPSSGALPKDRPAGCRAQHRRADARQAKIAGCDVLRETVSRARHQKPEVSKQKSQDAMFYVKQPLP